MFLGWVLLKIVLRALARFMMGHNSLEDIEQYSVENAQKVVCICERTMHDACERRALGDMIRVSCAICVMYFTLCTNSPSLPPSDLFSLHLPTFPTSTSTSTGPIPQRRVLRGLLLDRRRLSSIPGRPAHDAPWAAASASATRATYGGAGTGTEKGGAGGYGTERRFQ